MLFRALLSSRKLSPSKGSPMKGSKSGIYAFENKRCLVPLLAPHRTISLKAPRPFQSKCICACLESTTNVGAESSYLRMKRSAFKNSLEV